VHLYLAGDSSIWSSRLPERAARSAGVIAALIIGLNVLLLLRLKGLLD
jgi:hypothetical protein